MKLIFYLQINKKVFCKFIWACVARHPQSTQNNKFVKTWRMKLIFCLQLNIKSFFKSIVPFRCLWPDMPKLPKATSLLFLCNFFFNKKKFLMKLIFCTHINMKVSYKLILWFLMGMVKHSQSFQNSNFTMSLQISQKKIMGMIKHSRKSNKIVMEGVNFESFCILNYFIKYLF